ncbi:MAG: dephospho-CoA kinase [Firmicutes bacterium]|nr:dephospho-CoA kinase [Bacillota bacterium]
MLSKPYKIGITGCIGSGKSEVSRYLTSLDYPLIDADAISKEVVMPGEIGLIKLVETFGESILNHDHTLNRKKLGELVFNNQFLLEQLNSVLHTIIRREIANRLATYSTEPFVFIDVPLLFETDSRSNYDEIVLVYAKPEICLERIVKRDGISSQLAKQKIDAQMDIEWKRSLSDTIFSNEGSIEQLHHQIEAYLVDLKKRI